jgi:hypothetical protein
MPAVRLAILLAALTTLAASAADPSQVRFGRDAWFPTLTARDREQILELIAPKLGPDPIVILVMDHRWRTPIPRAERGLDSPWARFKHWLRGGDPSTDTMYATQVVACVETQRDSGRCIHTRYINLDRAGAGWPILEVTDD